MTGIFFVVSDRLGQFKKLFGPYAAFKLALSLWTLELARQLFDQEGITMVTVDPGGNTTIRKGKKSGIPQKKNSLPQA